MSAITVKNVYKIFGSNTEEAFKLIDRGKSKEQILDQTGSTVAINNASFEVNLRETFVIMGLSGSGKSTLLRCINRLIEPSRGQVWIGDLNVLDVDKEQLLELRRTKMSMVFQRFGLLPHRSVLKNVEFGLEISGMAPEQREEKAMDALELVGLKGYEHQMTDELSGGMQQRVGLARALANDPEILLMDEAFSALDPLIRADMQDELLALQARMHKTILFITHDLDEALKIGDRIAIMKDGYVVQVGTPEEILTSPATDYVKAFVENVDRTKIITAQTIMKKAPSVIHPKDGPQAAIRRMEKIGMSTIYVTDADKRLKGIVTIDEMIELNNQEVKDLGSKINDDIQSVFPETPIRNIFRKAMTAPYPIAVTNDSNELLGIVDRATILAEIRDVKTSAPRHTAGVEDEIQQELE